jgi:regulator of RNase E activity RraB
MDNADAIRRLVEDGSDLARPMPVEFVALIAGPCDVGTVGEAVERLGYEVEFYRDEEEDALECVCARTMLVSVSSIEACERELSDLFQRFGAELDGWGSFGNADR